MSGLRVKTRNTLVTVPCQTDLQVNLMRFSSVFQPPAVPQPVTLPRRAAQADEEPPAATRTVPGQDLPEDLDERVRLIGEWQLGEFS